MSGWTSNTLHHAIRLVSWAVSLLNPLKGMQKGTQAVLAHGSWLLVTSFSPQA